ncbi:MAG: DUF2182 domain-containing protein [Ilumatobacteraceae bacterium]
MQSPSVADSAAPQRRAWSGSLVDIGGAAVLWAAAVVASVSTMDVLGAHDAATHHGHGDAGFRPSAAVVGASAAMTLAMMLPTAVQMLRSLADVLAARRASASSRTRGAEPSPEWWAFLAAYTTVWAAVSTVFAVAQAALRAGGLAGDGGSVTARLVAAAALAAAGAYQFTTVKAWCLAGCARPITFLLASWRAGVTGAWRMGLVHAVTCVGCCWALMALALVGGLHSLPFMVVATVVMVVEKLPSIGERVRVPLGVMLVAAGAAAALMALA